MSQHHFSPIAPKSGLIGHRGIAAMAPENTKASFELAALQGIDWVEFDVRLTKDNELVIFHDDTLERTTNGKGLVHEHTLDQLKELDAGSWFSPRFKDQTIPVFAQCIPLFHQLGLFINIELKIPPNASKHHRNNLVDLLFDVLVKHWPKTKPWPLVSSFHWDLLAHLREKLPQIPIGFLHDNCSRKMIEMVSNTPNSALHCGFESLSSPLMALCQAQSIPVLAFTVNEPKIAKELLQGGLYGIFCDDPHHLLSHKDS